LTAFGLLLAVTYNAMATRPAPVSEVKTLHENASLSGTGFVTFEPYLPIEPIFTGVITITGTAGLPTLPAPIYSYASGTVDLVALERSGTVSGNIRLTTRGMAPGTYTVSAVTESSSDTVVLGSMSVTTGSIPVYISGSGSTPVEYYPAPWLSVGTARFGGTAHPFPAGFSPFDVASVSLSDSNDNIVGTATLTPVRNGYLTELSPVQPGPLAGVATGYALVHADTPPILILDPLPIIGPVTFSADAETSASQGAGGTLSLTNSGTITLAGGGTYTGVTTVGSGSLTIEPINPGGTLTIGPVSGGTILSGDPIFTGGPLIQPAGRIAIHAAGLPPHTVVTYAVDGTDIGTAMTDSAGKLNVFAKQGDYGKIPSSIDMFTVSTLTVHDGGGNLYLSASF
jgi:hypothetical protein